MGGLIVKSVQLSTPCPKKTFKRKHRAACRTKDGVQSLISGGTVTIKCSGRLILSLFCPNIDRERRDYIKIHYGLLDGVDGVILF